LLAGLALALTGMSCGDECGIVDICMPQLAMIVVVPSGESGSVANVSLQAAGLFIPPASCVVAPDATHCRVMGNPGRYALAVSAPGFATVQRSVTVNGTYTCGCASVTTENVVVVLSPTS
jgi:hypothetical protein